MDTAIRKQMFFTFGTRPDGCHPAPVHLIKLTKLVS